LLMLMQAHMLVEHLRMEQSCLQQPSQALAHLLPFAERSGFVHAVVRDASLK